jgi:hypothetical protein
MPSVTLVPEGVASLPVGSSRLSMGGTPPLLRLTASGGALTTMNSAESFALVEPLTGLERKCHVGDPWLRVVKASDQVLPS